MILRQYANRVMDWYLTRKTGKRREDREYESWLAHNVNRRASQIRHGIFQHFRHVIVVNPDKFFDLQEPFSWVPCQDARQYMWPERALGDNMVWLFERVTHSDYENDWVINALGDRDLVFVATNNDSDAAMLAIKYS